ncbi:MAG: diguanylate cyclase [Syntrophaceae bacterium]|nr:diguanylate cyclase [Syntrophaceae bacterium]
MEKFADYILQEKINETRNSIIYRGHKENEAQQFIIKLLRTKYPTPSEIARFKQEYNLVKKLDIKNIIKIFDLVEYDDKYAIIEEDFGGKSLKETLKAENLGLKSFLHIAEKVSETLGLIHENNVIHLDIKPDNILINAKQDIVKITDFGISAALTHANDELYNPEVIKGTLPYISPEQTGRMNRNVDYRTDLYSMGITFYEMLTGNVPFQSKDPMELIHSHIAITPEPPVVKNSEIPVIISDMIMKLMAKSPEDRYQNGFGVMADISECIKQLEEKQKIEPFELAKHDISNKFIIPRRLLGRDKEIETLISSFKDISDRETGAAIMVVAGSPGIGKSSLVNEIQRPIVASRGYFISGKYELFRRDKPYSAIIQSFQFLAKQILSESEDKVSLWRDNLLKALGVNGKIITDVIPEIELIIGKQPDLQALGPEESRNRFNFVFEKFIGVFPKKEHPVALFLDDLQWADLASLRLMKNILTNPDIHYLFLILSYRDNEVGEFHPVTDFLREAKKNNIRITRVAPGPLTEKDVNDLISNSLRCPHEKAAGLASLVLKKTGGNPFFVNQFLQTLYNEKIIVHEGARGWRWDAESISRMQVTENLVEMMAGKIGKLSTDTQEALKICACIGNRFDLETMASVLSISVDQALHDLTEAVNEGMVSRIGNLYVFHHDRIHEAAYSLVSEEEKQGLHYRIGRSALDNVSSDEDLEKKIFYIIDQLNMGSALLKDKKEYEELLRLNIRAGIKAKENAAYETSLECLEKGMILIDEQKWENQFDILIELYSEATEVSYMKGDFEKMQGYGSVVLDKTKDLQHIARIYQVWCEAKISQDDYMGALDLARPILSRLGVRIPNNPSQLRLVPEFLKTWFKLFGKSDKKILNLPLMTDPLKLAATRLLSSIMHAIFFAEPNILGFITFYMVRMSLKHGLAPDHPMAYAVYGAVLCEAVNDVAGSYRFGKLAMKMVERLNVRNKFSRTAFCYNILCRHWREHRRESIEPSLEAFNKGVETGDLLWASLNLVTYGAASALTGKECSEFVEELEKHNRMIGSLKQYSIIRFHALQWQYILNMMGRCDNPLELQGKALEGGNVKRWEDEHNLGALAVFYFLRLTVRFLFNEYSLAYEDARQFRKYKKAMAGVIILPHFYGIDTINRYFLLMLNKESFVKRIIHRIYIQTNLFFLKYWAKRAPMNSLNFVYGAEAIRLLVKDERKHPSRRRPERPVKLALECISLSKEHGDVIVEGLANEILGMAYFNIYSDEEKARESIGNAYKAYRRWGAAGKLKQLSEKYPWILSPSRREVSAAADSDSTGTASTISSTATGTGAAALDLSTVMKVSQVISSEIMLDRLLQKIMHLSIANAGAQRGYLILDTDGELTIEASEDTDKKESLVMQSMPLKECPDICEAIVNYVHHSGKDVVFGNAAQESPFTNDPYIMRTQCKSIVCSPIVSKGSLSGILYMENNLSLDAFTSERLDILRMFSAQAAISIDNARLFELATTDGLTKLYVHRYFQVLLDKEMKLSSRHDKKFSLIMMDIDNFKSFNDTYGHQLGDEVLRSVAKAVKNTSRTEDIAARYGGEEFVVILPETDAQQAMTVAEKIRASVAEIKIPHGDQKLQVTISLGVSTYPEHAGQKEALIQLADAALYTSKRNGKNRVSLCGNKDGVHDSANLMKRAKESHREDVEKYRNILENMQEGYFETDLAGNYTFFNDSLCRIHGHPREELMGMNDRQYMEKEVAKKVFKAFNGVYKTGEPLKSIDWQITRKDGAKRFVEASVSLRKDEFDNPIGFRGIIHDITERKQAEELRYQSEEKYRNILETIQESYIEIDLAGNFTFFNNSLCQLSGYSNEELMGMNYRQYTDKENAKKLFQVFNKLYNTGEPTKGFDWHITRKDGTKIYVESSASLQKDLSGKTIGFRGIIRDITERKQVESQNDA